jgi:uncharacterized protein (DUF1778 family)
MAHQQNQAHDTFIPSYTNTTVLSERDWETFQEALEEEEPNENLKKAAQKHNELMSSSDKL